MNRVASKTFVTVGCVGEFFSVQRRVTFTSFYKPQTYPLYFTKDSCSFSCPNLMSQFIILRKSFCKGLFYALVFNLPRHRPNLYSKEKYSKRILGITHVR